MRKPLSLARFASRCQEMAGSYRAVLKLDPCAYCAWRPPKKRNRTLDHIQPESKGGRGSWENMTLSCLFCNRLKGSMDLLEFLLSRREQLVSRRHAIYMMSSRMGGGRIDAIAVAAASSASMSKSTSRDGDVTMGS